MTFGDAVVQICKHVINNMTELTVNRIKSQNKHDMRIENGAGASILLTGEQVLINGYSGGSGSSGGDTFDIIYLGADHKCWIARDSSTGNMIIRIPYGTMLEFERGTDP